MTATEALLLAAPGAEEESDNIFILPNATFAVELIAFVILLAIIWRYIVPPVQQAMKQRQDTIARQLSDSEEATKKLAEAKDAYERALADARHEANRLREDARAQHKAIVDEAAADAQARADEITSRARDQLAAERDSAIRAVQAEVGKLAVDLAGKVVGESLEDEARQRRVVDRFIEALEGERGADRANGAAAGAAASHGESVR